jgi:hypothetical protein
VLLALPWIVWYEGRKFVGVLLLEPSSLRAVPAVLGMLPRTLAKRRATMAKRVATAAQMRAWFR